MPELPEVETIARQLNGALKGKTVSDIEVIKERCFHGDAKRIIGWEVESVGRKSKVIEILFSGQEDMIIIHLKMTGQLILVSGKERIAGGHPTVDWVNKLPSSHTRVIIDFSDGSKLFFNDMRMFGWMKLVSKEKYEKEIKKQAPDVVDSHFTEEYFGQVLKKSGRAVKLVLMDQEKIGGVGNIYANDALYLAEIMPDRKANSLSLEETKKLFDAVKKVINLGIKYGGASAADDKYVNASGLGGKYQEHFLVYQKEGEVCKRCGGKILKTRLGGRGTFYCPGCQR